MINQIPAPRSTQPAFTFVNVLTAQAAKYPDREAFKLLVDGEQEEASITYRELDRQARAIAAQLQSFVSVGERALLLYPPGLEYVAAFFGCLYAGVVAVPAYPPDPMRLDRTLPRLQTILADAQASVVLTSTPILALAELMFNQAPDLGALEWLATDGLAAGLEYHWSVPQLHPASLAFLQYTSGSTRTPRGVMVTHANLIHNAQMIYEAFGMRPDDVGVIWLPPYHDMGLIGGLLEPVYGGVKSILIPTLAFLQRPIRWLQAISRYRGTVSGGPNFAYELCARKVSGGGSTASLKELDLSSWSLAFTGAEPVRSETLANFKRVFESYGFHQEAFYPCYGLAEATLIVSGGKRSRGPKTIQINSTALSMGKAVFTSQEHPGTISELVSCGNSIGEQILLVVDPEGHPCPQGQVGEIWISGPNVAAGYWNRPDETSLVFNGRLKSSPKDAGQIGVGGPRNQALPSLENRTFLCSGDLGFIWQRELVITGRIKDLIILDGLNHYPQDIEQTIEACHPAIRPGGSAAFSVEIENQERLIAVAEIDFMRGGIGQLVASHQSLEDIARSIRRDIALRHNVHVHEVCLLQPRSIPKTSSGKIQRHACKAGYQDGSLELWEIPE